MTWVKLDDGFFDNPKVVGLGADGQLLYLAALCYCSRHLTDGMVPKPVLQRLTGKRRNDRATTALVDAGLWIDEGDYFRIHDYAAHQRTREEVLGIRDGSRRRQALNRNTEMRAAIKRRDGDHCRYCNREVNWTDRRGPAGGTYDHVIPDGPDTLENLVVACRSCNSAKQHRTPEQARMPLLRPRSDLGPNLKPSRPEAETDTETEAEFVFPLEVPGGALLHCGTLGSDALRAYDAIETDDLR